jgi:hypothetical protein
MPFVIALAAASEFNGAARIEPCATVPEVEAGAAA